MFTTFCRLVILLVAAAWVLTASTAHAQVQILFMDDFESGNLDQWTGKNGGFHRGQIVTDPLNPPNNVLNFTSRTFGGDMFTASELDLTAVSGPFVLSFDYLGLADGDPNPNNLGGFIGISMDLNPINHGKDHFWLAGTDTSAIFFGDNFAGVQLIDDGTWQHYDIDFSCIVALENLMSIHVMTEQWSGSGGLAGHAYFDDIKLQAGSAD